MKLFWQFIIVIIMSCSCMYADAFAINQSRVLLSRVRGGDYAHPGDAQAVEMIIKQLELFDADVKSRNMLDIGCGMGGTLDYFQNHGFSKLKGIDIDAAAIEYASQKYPDIVFEKADILDPEAFSVEEKFDLITLFSVAYSFADEASMIESLSKVAPAGALLVVFDYSLGDALSVKDFAGINMRPINPQEFASQLVQHEWRVLKSQDLSAAFLMWYDEFMQGLEREKDTLIAEFSEEVYMQVHSTFSYFIDLLKEKKLSGHVIYAEKI